MNSFRRLHPVLAVLPLILSFSLNAFADDDGTVGGGGGRAVVCRDSKKQIKTAEMWDLYEGRVLYGWKPNHDNRDFRIQYREAIHNIAEGRNMKFPVVPGTSLPPDVATSWVEAADYTFKSFHFIEAGLTLVNDSHELIKPDDGCLSEQVADNVDYDLPVDRRIWDKFDNSSKAALVVHETIYAMARLTGEKTSIRSRRLVALAFSGHKFKSIYANLPNQYVTCILMSQEPGLAGISRILLYIDQNKKIQLQADVVNGMFQYGANPQEIGSITDPSDVFWRTATLRGFSTSELNSDVDRGTGLLDVAMIPTADHRYKMWMHLIDDSRKYEYTISPEHPEPPKSEQVTCTLFPWQVVDGWDQRFVIAPPAN